MHSSHEYKGFNAAAGWGLIGNDFMPLSGIAARFVAGMAITLPACAYTWTGQAYYPAQKAYARPDDTVATGPRHALTLRARFAAPVSSPVGSVDYRLYTSYIVVADVPAMGGLLCMSKDKGWYVPEKTQSGLACSASRSAILMTDSERNFCPDAKCEFPAFVAAKIADENILSNADLSDPIFIGTSIFTKRLTAQDKDELQRVSPSELFYEFQLN